MILVTVEFSNLRKDFYQNLESSRGLDGYYRSEIYRSVFTLQVTEHILHAIQIEAEHPGVFITLGIVRR